MRLGLELEMNAILKIVVFSQILRGKGRGQWCARFLKRGIVATGNTKPDVAKKIIAMGKIVNSLTAKSVPAGTKNSRPVGFYSRNSTKSALHHKHNNPQTLPPWWCCLPLTRRGIYGSARSDARNLFRRGRAGGWWKRII